jgi:hypothetical protein
MHTKLKDAVLVLWEQSADTRNNLGREALERGMPLHRIRCQTFSSSFLFFWWRSPRKGAFLFFTSSS